MPSAARAFPGRTVSTPGASFKLKKVDPDDTAGITRGSGSVPARSGIAVASESEARPQVESRATLAPGQG